MYGVCLCAGLFAQHSICEIHTSYVELYVIYSHFWKTLNYILQFIYPFYSLWTFTNFQFVTIKSRFLWTFRLRSFIEHGSTGTGYRRNKPRIRIHELMSSALIDIAHSSMSGLSSLWIFSKNQFGGLIFLYYISGFCLIVFTFNDFLLLSLS